MEKTTFGKFTLYVDEDGIVTLTHPESHDASSADCNDPDFYEGIYTSDGALTVDAILATIIDYFDFSNRDLTVFPIQHWERALIEASFDAEQIARHFPALG